MIPITFGDLKVGDLFHFALYEDSGLLADMTLPGRHLYRKVSARKLECVGYRGVRFDDRLAKSKLRKLGVDDPAEFIRKARINRSNPIGSVKARVWQTEGEAA